LTIASIRNPWTRLISLYQSLQDEKDPRYFGMGWEQFVLSRQFNSSMTYRLSQHHDYVPPPGCERLRIDRLIPYEKLNYAVACLPFVQPEWIIPKKHASINLGLTFTNIMIKHIQQVYKEDFKRFNYYLECPEDLTCQETS
jgi:hypothetical protein